MFALVVVVVVVVVGRGFILNSPLLVVDSFDPDDVLELADDEQYEFLLVILDEVRPFSSVS